MQHSLCKLSTLTQIRLRSKSGVGRPEVDARRFSAISGAPACVRAQTQSRWIYLAGKFMFMLCQWHKCGPLSAGNWPARLFKQNFLPAATRKTQINAQRASKHATLEIEIRKLSSRVRDNSRCKTVDLPDCRFRPDIYLPTLTTTTTTSSQASLIGGALGKFYPYIGELSAPDCSFPPCCGLSLGRMDD